jgi:hypothetical protein
MFSLQCTTLFNNKELAGMISISRRNPSIKVIGRFSMISDFRTFLGNCRQGGWDRMKSMKFMIMALSLYLPLTGMVLLFW